MALPVLLSLDWEERRRGCHDKEEKWDSERCPPGAVAADGWEGGLTTLLHLQVAGDHVVHRGPTPHSHVHETYFAEITGDWVAHFILRWGWKDDPLLDLYQSDRMSPLLYRGILNIWMWQVPFCSACSGDSLCQWEERNKERPFGDPQGVHGLHQQAWFSLGIVVFTGANCFPTYLGTVWR